MNIVQQIKTGLKKSSNFLKKNIIDSVKLNTLPEEFIQNIESVLISADIGLEVTNHIIKKIKNKKYNNNNINEILNLIAEEIIIILKDSEKSLLNNKSSNTDIFMFSGVNGSGKTTTIGKLISKINDKKVLVAACDTFRAAAVEQLKEWSIKNSVDFFSGQLNQDPASVAYGACEKAKKENYDYLLIDTAGRLSNNTNLINQLIKIKSVILKNFNSNQLNNILVLDGTNGSNMLTQVETFTKAINISGLIITKLDGTAKGGAIISIAQKSQIPINFIGLGEKDNDLHEFNAKSFAYSLLDISIENEKHN